MSLMQWDDGRIRLMPGDCRDLIAMLPDNSVASVVTDPPYEIGFMNLGFDSTGIASDVILWKDILRVLKPGGHVAAFAASRTYHRLACAIEGAGFEIRDQIDWVYASGMPHGSDARLLVDRELGTKGRGAGTANGQAEQWAGWYSQLKPAHEPICLARKPLDGTLAHNLLGHGTGALHIDSCRVPFRNAADEKESKNKNRHADFNSGPRDNHIYGVDKADRTDYTAEARFAPNMLFDQSTAKELDRQSGVTVSRKGRPRASTKPGDGWGMTHTGAEYDDMGGASRFYPVFRYCPKAGPGERPTVDGIRHPTVKPLELMRWLVRLVTPPDGLVLEPFAGSGATLEACRIEDVRCVAAEMDSDYVRLIARRMARPTNPVLF
ncbi:DNA-methyltransferase [Bifidobacterium longum]|uniref:Methyltransferase n=1 Tax=Bifidobacterium longum TaxID=216816 RepID=A0A395Y270_BIFLN|nr:site-specific DNA-methyltransferase [Bifidobacterium longum]RGW56909.1 site-specific DNA-methyltransferase [Bifidobacterium longum]RGW65096.1 site-specific DNA-methyltransferase [Bifidobacterium longum]